MGKKILALNQNECPNKKLVKSQILYSVYQQNLMPNSIEKKQTQSQKVRNHKAGVLPSYHQSPVASFGAFIRQKVQSLILKSCIKSQSDHQDLPPTFLGLLVLGREIF